MLICKQLNLPFSLEGFGNASFLDTLTYPRPDWPSQELQLAPAVLHPKCWSAGVRASDATGLIPASAWTGGIIWSHSVYCEWNMLFTCVIRILTLHRKLHRYLQLTVTEETCKPSNMKLSVGWNKRAQWISWHNVWLFISICIDQWDRQSLILECWLAEARTLLYWLVFTVFWFISSSNRRNDRMKLGLFRFSISHTSDTFLYAGISISEYMSQCTNPRRLIYLSETAQCCFPAAAWTLQSWHS